jgi:hypothetical protein
MSYQTHRLLVSDLRNISISVISTEASHSFTVRGAAEKSAFLPNPEESREDSRFLHSASLRSE